MANSDPKKPQGKMSAYAFFVQTCREEHKKKNSEVPVSFAEFSKCSERWKTMSAKEKSKFDEMAKADKAHYDPEMKDYGPAKGGKRKEPNVPKGQRLDFSFSAQNSAPRSNPQTLEFLLEMWQKKLSEMWNNLSDSEKQPYNNKAAKVKKYEEDLANHKSKGKFDGAKGLAKVAQKKVKDEEEEEEQMEEEEEEEEEKE